MRAFPESSRGGFSLIEITLAIFVFVMGILVLFALFPAALRMSADSVADSHAAMFGRSVMAGMHAYADSVTDWNQWKSQWTDSDLSPQLTIRDPVDGYVIPVKVTPDLTVVPYPTIAVNNPNRSSLRYSLRVSGTGTVKYVELIVDGAAYGNVRASAFYTELYYRGNP